MILLADSTAALLSVFSIFDSNILPSDEDKLTTCGQQSLEILMRVYGEAPDALDDLSSSSVSEKASEL